MIRAFVAALALSTSTLTMTAPAASQPIPLPDGQIDRLSAQQMMQMLQRDPETLSMLGLVPPQPMPGSPYAELTPQSSEERESTLKQMKASLAQLEAIDRAAVAPDQALSYDIWQAWLAAEIGALETGLSTSSGPYVVDQFWVQGLPYLFLSLHQLTSPFLAEAYVQRLEKAAGMIEQRRAFFESDAARGVTPPQFIIDNVIADIDALLKPAPKDHAIYLKLASGMPEGVDDPDPLKARAMAALEDQIYPAYRRLQESLRATRDSARTEKVGMVGLPDGLAQYAALAKKWTTVEVDPDQLHALGLAEVARITAEIDRRLTALGYTEGSLKERVDAATKASNYGFTKDEAGEKALLEETRKMVENAKRRTAEYFTRFPKADVETIPVPKAAQSSAPNSYTPPAADGSRPGIFNINLRDPSGYTALGYPTLVYHETIPGHHYQIALKQESDLPILRRFLPFSAYSEGWGLYVETQAEAMGLYEDNPVGVVGALGGELFRAARLVVDTGIHAKGWSREQAQQFMAQTVGDPSVREVDRYMVLPGQALSYKVGQLKIAELRARAEQRLGDKFSIAAFHDEILRDGSMPLSVLEAKIDRWIEAQAGR